MAAPLTAVFDTNILISALLSPNGPPARSVTLARLGVVSLVLCTEILEELKEKLRTKLNFSNDNAAAAVEEIHRIATLITISHSIRAVDDDPDDDIVLDCAVSGNANYIVTGDRHLLVLGAYRDVHIVRAADFVAMALEQQR